MANNVWENNDVDGNANNANNWSLGWVPKAGDTMVENATSTANSTLTSASISCDAVDVQAGYSGILDLNGYNLVTTGAQTYAGTGTMDCGEGTLEFAGNFTNTGQTTWTQGTSTLKATGASKSLALKASQIYNNLTVTGTYNTTGSGAYPQFTGTNTISGTLTVSTTHFYLQGVLTVSGTITVDSGKWLTTVGGTSVTISEGGSLTGLGKHFCGEGSTITNSGTYDVALTELQRNATIAAGTYGGTWTITQFVAISYSVIFSGNAVFTGNVTVLSEETSGTYTFDLATNDKSIRFDANLHLNETGAGSTLVWSKATTGTVTFGGTTIYTDDTAAVQNLGDVISSGTSLQLASDMKCDDFDLTAGAFDINGANTLTVLGAMDWAVGATITDPAGGIFNVTGNFTCNGQSLVGTTTWQLNVTGTATASGVGTFTNCNASGGSEIQAIGWTDGGGNTNINFGTAFGGANQIIGSNVLA